MTSLTRHPSPPAFTAAFAALLAVTTLTPLFDSPGWILVAAVVLALIASTGLLVHRWSSSPWVVALAQSVVGLVVCGWWFGGSTFWGLPTWTTLARLGQLYRVAATEINTGSAPLALTAALQCALVSLTCLIAVAVHAVAIGCRAPGAAGLILFLPIAAAVANTGSGLSWLSFTAPAAGWLLLIGRDTATALSRWSTVPALALTPTGSPRSEDQAATGLGTRVLSLGVTGLVTALVVGAVLPHLPTRYVLDGLAEGVGGRAGGSRVGYSSTLDVSRSLTSGDTAELLRYRTTAQTASPLRVLVATAYEQGIWSRPNPTLGSTVRVDLATAVPRTEQTVTVTDNRLTAPALAAPQPLSGGDFKGVGWQVDTATGDVHVAARPSDYSVTYLAPEITPTLLRDGVDGRPGDDRLPGNRLVQQSLLVDPASAGRISALAAEVTAGTATRYDAAVAIQQWLRSGGGFTYSLDLGDDPTGTTGVTPTDPVTRFLDSRRGYCVQFATTMVMMARARGSPPGWRSDSCRGRGRTASMPSRPPTRTRGRSSTSPEPAGCGSNRPRAVMSALRRCGPCLSRHRPEAPAPPPPRQSPARRRVRRTTLSAGSNRRTVTSSPTWSSRGSIGSRAGLPTPGTPSSSPHSSSPSRCRCSP